MQDLDQNIFPDNERIWICDFKRRERVGMGQGPDRGIGFSDDY